MAYGLIPLTRATRWWNVAWQDSKGFDKLINVPFCPESKLSGVGYTDFINGVWYKRNINIPASCGNKKILLHFGEVDYRCETYIDNKLVGTHSGGTSAFTFDITATVKPGISHSLVLYVKNDSRSGMQSLGKQSFKYASSGARYTRTTGIWQTVGWKQ